MRERFLEVDGRSLFVREWGEADSPAVVFWHALGDHTGLQIAEAAPDLVAGHRLRVVAVDAPGFGRSQALDRAEQYLAPALARLVVDLLDVLEVDRAGLLGASWGGTVAVHTAAAHPGRVRGIALLDGGYRDPPGATDDSLEALRAHWRGQAGFRYPSWETLFEESRSFFGRWSPALEEAARDAFEERNGEVCSRMGPDLYATVIWALHRSPPSHAFGPLAARRVPVLALTATEPADEEREAALAVFRELVPGADVRPLAGRHHWLLEEAPGEVADDAGRWLRSL